MIKREVEVKDGEVAVLKILFGHSSLDEVIKESYNKGFKFDSLGIDSVEKMTDERWRSTQESTLICPILYLSRQDGMKALILKATSDNYWLSEYRFTP